MYLINTEENSETDAHLNAERNIIYLFHAYFLINFIISNFRVPFLKKQCCKKISSIGPSSLKGGV